MRAANSPDSGRTDITSPRLLRVALSLATLAVAMLAAPTSAVAQAAVRQTPTVAWAAKLGFRDWGDVVRVNGLIVGSNSSERRPSASWSRRTERSTSARTRHC